MQLCVQRDEVRVPSLARRLGIAAPVRRNEGADREGAEALARDVAPLLCVDYRHLHYPARRGPSG